MSGEIEDLRQELAATQFWLRTLFCVSAPDAKEEARAIRKTIVDLKNFPPKDHWNAAEYDRLAARRLPHIERIGNDIADTLDPPA